MLKKQLFSEVPDFETIDWINLYKEPEEVIRTVGPNTFIIKPKNDKVYINGFLIPKEDWQKVIDGEEVEVTDDDGKTVTIVKRNNDIIFNEKPFTSETQPSTTTIIENENPEEPQVSGTPRSPFGSNPEPKNPNGSDPGTDSEEENPNGNNPSIDSEEPGSPKNPGSNTPKNPNGRDPATDSEEYNPNGSDPGTDSEEPGSPKNPQSYTPKNPNGSDPDTDSEEYNPNGSDPGIDSEEPGSPKNPREYTPESPNGNPNNPWEEEPGKPKRPKTPGNIQKKKKI